MRVRARISRGWPVKSPRFLRVGAFGYSGPMTAVPLRLVSIVLERTALDSPWAAFQWDAVAAMADQGGDPRVLFEREGRLQVLFPGFEVRLHRDEAEGYYLNVSSGTPCVFVSLRVPEDGPGTDPLPFLVTASYNEAARWMDGGERVERAPVDGDFAAWIGDWVAQNYRPEKKERIRPNSFKGREGRLRERD